jgi:hypothetical protein
VAAGKVDEMTKDQQPSQLLPCPFCGERPEVNERTGIVRCHAPRCGVQVMALSENYWNTRAALHSTSEGRVEAVRKVRDGYASQMKFCDIEALGYFREFVRRLDAALQ